MREIGRVLAPGGLFGFADLFAVCRRGLPSRLTGRVDLPPPARATLAAAGLGAVDVSTADGFGPIPAITVVLAALASDDGCLSANVPANRCRYISTVALTV